MHIICEKQFISSIMNNTNFDLLAFVDHSMLSPSKFDESFQLIIYFSFAGFILFLFPLIKSIKLSQ